MSIRITQGMIYDKYVGQMQNSLGAYMDSSEQGSTQKKINRPSDDPAGMYRILRLRQSTNFNEQLLSNCDTAKGWLKLEDSVLSTQVPTVVTNIKALAEQASTGTYTAEQRRDIAMQVRQQFGSLINMSNTEFDGKNLFSGHKYGSPAFQQGLAFTSKQSKFTDIFDAGKATIDGDASSTIAFTFMSDGKVSDLTDGIGVRWTDDGGTHFYDETIVPTQTENGDYLLDMTFKGVSAKLTVSPDLELKAPKDPNAFSSYDDTIYIRPAAFYQGDTNDSLKITYMGVGEGDAENAETFLKAKAEGTFSGNVLVRLNSFLADGATEESSNIPVGEQGTLTWEYSTDNGMNWVTAKASLPPAAGKDLRFPLPEGYVDVAQYADLPMGVQIMVHPEDANLDYEIMKDTYISVNAVGKDIFGGIYENKRALQDLDDPGRNLFEVVGSFIGYLETNNQEGCQESLAKLAYAEEHILTQAAQVGGLENRVDIAYDVLTSQKLDIKERLSYVEDIDLTELLVKMQQQQITYQTVLQSASKIMNMSLANYI